MWHDFQHAFNLNKTSHLVEWKALSPMPLTEEWRLKAGFVNNTLDLGNGASIWFWHNGYYLGGPGCPHENYAIVPDLRFVHQLQNLVYCLSGKELEFIDTNLVSIEPS